MTVFEELQAIVLSFSLGYVGVFGLVEAFQFVYNTFVNNETESSDEEDEEILDSELQDDSNENIRGTKPIAPAEPTFDVSDKSKFTEEIKVGPVFVTFFEAEDPQAHLFEMEKQLETNYIEKEHEQLNFAQNIISEALENRNDDVLVMSRDDANTIAKSDASNFIENERLGVLKLLEKREYFDNQSIIKSTESTKSELNATNLMLQESTSVSSRLRRSPQMGNIHQYDEMETNDDSKLNSNTDDADNFEIISKTESYTLETADLQDVIKDSEELLMQIVTTGSEDVNDVQMPSVEEFVEQFISAEQNMVKDSEELQMQIVTTGNKDVNNLQSPMVEEIEEFISAEQNMSEGEKTVEYSQIIINNITVLDSIVPENLSVINHEEKVESVQLTVNNRILQDVPILVEPMEVIEDTINENQMRNLQNEKWRDEHSLVVEGLSDFYDFQASSNPLRSRDHSRNTSQCESLCSSSQNVPEIAINSEVEATSILTTEEIKEMKGLVQSFRSERLRVETNENVSEESTEEMVQRLRIEAQNSRSRSRSPLPTPQNIEKSLEKRRNKLIEQNNMAFEKLGLKMESTDAEDSLEAEKPKGECTVPLNFSSTVRLTTDTESIQQTYSFDDEDLDIDNVLNMSSDDNDVDSIDMINENEYFEEEYEEHDLEDSEDERQTVVEIEELKLKKKYTGCVLNTAANVKRCKRFLWRNFPSRFVQELLMC